VTDYLTSVEIMAIHADQIERYGSAQGVRDEALLDAAVKRPQTGYYENLFEEAAALWESLSQNHAFVDGNKRTAFASAYTFLVINGVEISADADSTFEFLNELYQTGDLKFARLNEWLKTNTRHI
jgi:death-on-curing protein